MLPGKFWNLEYLKWHFLRFGGRFYRILKIINRHINYKTHKALEHFLVKKWWLWVRDCCQSPDRDFDTSRNLYYREGKQEASLLMMKRAQSTGAKTENRVSLLGQAKGPTGSKCPSNYNVKKCLDYWLPPRTTQPVKQHC